LAGTQIPLGSRIIAACDAYDAIVSERSYDAARSSEDALAELRANAGSQFDPQVVTVLCEHVELHPAIDSLPAVDAGTSAEDMRPSAPRRGEVAGARGGDRGLAERRAHR
jgi:HD-GYP domain-containing protein (c-di-GMP phosphodiesterase class II)